MLKVVHDADVSNENNAAGGSLLDEIVRDGARAMLAAALQAEVAAYIDAHAGEVDENGYRLVVRNGYHGAREVLTATGAVPVKAPRVNDKRIDADTGERRRFSSAILPAWARKTPQVAEVLPLPYLHGLSSSDFSPALEQFLGRPRACRRRRSPGSPPNDKTTPSNYPVGNASRAPDACPVRTCASSVPMSSPVVRVGHNRVPMRHR